MASVGIVPKTHTLYHFRRSSVSNQRQTISRICDFGEYLVVGLEDMRHIRLRKGRREKQAFELGGSQIHPALQHAVEVVLELLQVAGFGIFEVVHQAVGEEQGDHRTDLIDGSRQAKLLDAFQHPIPELFRYFRQIWVHRFGALVQDAQHGQASRHRHRIS